MGRVDFKPGNMLYPLPAVLVSCSDQNGNDNLLTVAWTGTVCSDPAMVSISVRKERYSHQMIRETGEFVINLTTAELVRAVDFCGVRSGKDVDKWAEMKLHKLPAEKVKAPMLEESPVNIECKVTQILELGSHDMFLAEVMAVNVDESLLDEKGTLHLSDADLLAYSHGRYYGLGDCIGKFGYSVQKPSKGKHYQKDLG